MKYALVWRRILNEGFNGLRLASDRDNEAARRRIVKLPIIVDRRPAVDDRTDAFQDFKNLSFPFTRFWLEMPTTHPGVTVGAEVGVEKDDDGFVVRAAVFCASVRYPVHVIGCLEFGCDTQGNVRNGLHTRIPTLLLEADPDHAPKYVYMSAFMIADAMQMFGCKNVGLRQNDNDPVQVRRAVKRHGGKPDDYKYHTLIVRPPGARPDSPGEDIGVGDTPRHLCRGHFSEYGPAFGKGLLFGKYSGRFYIPPHLKGDKKNGTVEKDYAIGTPKPQLAQAG